MISWTILVKDFDIGFVVREREMSEVGGGAIEREIQPMQRLQVSVPPPGWGV